MQKSVLQKIWWQSLETPTGAAQSRSLTLTTNKNMFCTRVSKVFQSASTVFQIGSKGCQKCFKRYKSVTKALQKRYKSVTKVFQSVSNALQTCFKVFRGSFKRLWTHLGSQWEPQRVRRRVNLEHFGATRGNVKTMLPSRRNHHFLG